MVSEVIFSKAHNSIKMQMGLWFLFCAHRLIILYICTMICANITKGCGIIMLTRFPFRNLERGMLP